MAAIVIPGTSIAYTMEAVQLERAIRRFVDELGIELPLVVRRTFKAVIRDVVKLTPPKNAAQGRNAVERDISRAVYLLDFKKIENFTKLREAIRTRNYESVRAIIRNLPKKTNPLQTFQILPFSEELHTKARDNRGRVQRSKKIATLDATVYRRYVRKVRGHVGYTKSGWKPSADHEGLILPSWVSKHAGPPGSVHPNLSAEKPTITGTHAGKTTGSIQRHVINSAIRRRAIAMNKDVDRILKGGASRFI